MVSYSPPNTTRLRWIDIFAAAMLGFFLFSAHFSLIEQNIRFAIMFGSLGAMLIPAANNGMRVFQGKGLLYALIVISCCVSAYIHNLSSPPLTEYASQKRLYFYFALISCGLVIPLGLSRQKSMRTAIWILIGITMIFTVASFFRGDTGNIRRSAIGLNPTLLSKLVFFPALYLLVSAGGGFKNKLLFCLAIFGVFGCIASGSRGAILAFLVCVAIFGGSTLSLKDIFKFGFLGLIFLSLVAIALSFAPEEIANRFTLVSLESQFDEGNRLFLYDFSWNIFLENLNGIGIGNMSAYFWVYAPHNLILEALMDLGWLHAFPYLFLLIGSFFMAVRHFRSPNLNYRFICGWYIFMFINSMVGGEMSFPSLTLYIAMGLIWFFPRQVILQQNT